MFAVRNVWSFAGKMEQQKTQYIEYIIYNLKNNIIYIYIYMYVDKKNVYI